MSPPPSRWVASHQTRPDARLRLFCLPYAGGSSMIYRNWSKTLSADIEVCPVELPGRWMRMREPLHTDTATLVPAIMDGLLPLMDRPFAIFGHSLGALLAFELARECRRRQVRAPSRLYVSGRRAPHLYPVAVHGSFLHLDDNGLVDAMNRRYPGGFAPEVLADAELLSVVLPILRADMVMFEGYKFREEDPLDVPIVALGGANDDATPVADLEDWRRHSSKNLDLRTFDGHHFFLHTCEAALLEWLATDLKST
ncbi:MAG: thioesterase II family protein [Myxococcota bacterium]